MSVPSACSSILVLFMQLCCLVLVANSKVGDSGQLQLRIAYITTNDGQYISSGATPAVMLAMEEVNKVYSNRFCLQVTTFNISCDRTDSLQSYFEAIKSDEIPLIALLGCGCSPATEPVAEISFYSNIVHMSYVSSSSILSDRSRFQSFWRTYPSDNSANNAFLAVIQQYGWTQLKILTQEETLFIETTQTLTMMFRSNNIEVDQSQTYTLKTGERFQNISGYTIFSPEVRVYVLNMYEEQARRVLCEAVKVGARGHSTHYVPGYVWILHGWYKQRWWRSEVDDAMDCTDEQLEMLLQNSISILQIPGADDVTAPTQVELTAEEFQYKYEMNLGGNPFEPAASLAYDAVWALARALNESDITNVTNIVSDMRKTLSEDFSFLGVSGVVEFDANGTRRPHDTRIFQYRVNQADGLELVKVAVVPVTSDKPIYICGNISCESDDTVWPNGIPQDGTSKRVITTIKIPVFIIYTILAIIGTVFVIICLIFNIVFRNRKIVKLTSPNLNYIVLLGAFLLYSSFYFYVIPSKEEFTSTLYCHIRAWMQPAGYIICYNTILFKMWRVYYIFINPSAKKKRRVPKDWMLVIGVLIILSIFFVIMIGVTIFDDYKAKEVEDNETGTGRDEDKVIVEHYNLVCGGKRSNIWIILILGYILASQLVGVYLAFRTRKVKIKALNDAKYLAFIIYITTFIITGMIIGVISLSDFLNADAAAFCTGLFLVTTSVLALLFVPKMVILYKDPHGEKIFNRSMSQALPTMSMSDAERERLRDLTLHCKDLESRLSKYESVRPFRSGSSTRLASSNVDLSSSIHNITTSVSKPPFNETKSKSLPHPPTPPSNGYASADPTLPKEITADTGLEKSSLTQAETLEETSNV